MVSESGFGVVGNCVGEGSGVWGFGGDNGTGVIGQSKDHRTTDVYGQSEEGSGVVAYSTNHQGLFAHSDGSFGLIASTNSASDAAYLIGNVTITGSLRIQSGLAGVKMDHPLDPANKYLYHSFVESPDMKNVYDSVTVLDEKGEAVIELPDWFGAINKDFHYQLPPSVFLDQISILLRKYRMLLIQTTITIAISVAAMGATTVASRSQEELKV